MHFDLKKFRKDFDLKQSDLADILGIAQSFISKVERGVESFPNPHYETLKRKYGEEALKDYVSEKASTSTHQIVVGDGNITNVNSRNTGNILLGDGNKNVQFGNGVQSIMTGEPDQDLLMRLQSKIVDLEKIIIAKDGEIAVRDKEIEGLKTQLAIKTEMITFLQQHSKKA